MRSTRGSIRTRCTARDRRPRRRAAATPIARHRSLRPPTRYPSYFVAIRPDVRLFASVGASSFAASPACSHGGGPC